MRSYEPYLETLYSIADGLSAIKDELFIEKNSVSYRDFKVAIKNVIDRINYFKQFDRRDDQFWSVVYKSIRIFRAIYVSKNVDLKFKPKILKMEDLLNSLYLIEKMTS